MANKQPPEELITARNGIKYRDIEVGAGPKAWSGALIKCHYEGKLENGRVFDKSTPSRPLGFTVGVGEVIKGWDLGIAGTKGLPPMREGGKRKLVIPSELAYGKAGAGSDIPPNSTLIFTVELIDCERNSEDEEDEEEEGGQQ